MRTQAEPSAGWTLAQRRLHWLTAMLVMLTFPLGWLMVAIPLRDLLLKFLLFQLHKTLGLTLLAMAAGRLILRAACGRPHWDTALPKWRRHAAGAMHGTLYGMLLVVPLFGYLTAATAPSQVPTLFLGVIPIPHLVDPDDAAFGVLRLLHRWSAILLVVLACAHMLAAIDSHRRGFESLRLMWRGRTQQPVPSKRT